MSKRNTYGAHMRRFAKEGERLQKIAWAEQTARLHQIQAERDEMTKQRRATLAAPNLFGISCDQCGRQLVPTASGYLCCPNGHGRLVADDGPAQDGGGLFAESEADHDAA